MEPIHNASRRVWIDQKVINVQDFLNEFSESVSLSSNHRFDSIYSFQEKDEIAKQCGLEALRCEYQNKVEINDTLDMPNDVFLKTLRYQKEDLELRKQDNKYSSAHYASMKFCNYPPNKILKVDLNKLQPLPVQEPEVVLTVQIHSPERRIEPNVANYGKVPQFHADQEFLVLGCQYLTELRDMIDCISDKAIPGEFSDTPDSLPTETCKDIYKSGFFYINGTFYNDKRDKDCRDYSESIIKWSKAKGRGVGPFKKAVMEITRFVDLKLQLGYPYVYIHQGDCEHLIVFTELRLLSKNDVSNRNAYPMYTQVKTSKRIFCMVCHVFTASWVVYDNKRLPENPFFFCNQCYVSYNYDNANKKIGEFRAYYYPDRTRLF